MVISSTSASTSSGKPRKVCRRHSTYCSSPVSMDGTSSPKTPSGSSEASSKRPLPKTRSSQLLQRKASFSASPIRKSPRSMRSMLLARKKSDLADVCMDESSATTTAANDYTDSNEDRYFGVFKPRYNFKTSKNNLLDDVDISEMIAETSVNPAFLPLPIDNLNSYIPTIARTRSADSESSDGTQQQTPPRYHIHRITHRNNMIMLHSLHLLCTALCEKRNQFKVDVFDDLKRYIEEKRITEKIAQYHKTLIPLVGVIKDRDLNHGELETVAAIQESIQFIISETRHY